MVNGFPTQVISQKILRESARVATLKVNSSDFLGGKGIGRKTSHFLTP